jgi:hypothetical protein
MISSALRAEVSRNVAMGGGTTAVMRSMTASSITPGPLGMCDTNPTAAAPDAIASRASSGDLMQQILTRGRMMPSRIGNRTVHEKRALP